MKRSGSNPPARRRHAAGRLQQPRHPGIPAHLAVGEDLDTRLLLQLDRFLRGPVLGLAEIRAGQGALFPGCARLE
jgi:hypothetical protein